MDPDVFEEGLLSDGFSEIETEIYEFGPAVAEGCQPFSFRGLVLSGRLTLAIGDRSATCGEGEVFEVLEGTHYRKVVESDGTLVLVGRKRSRRMQDLTGRLCESESFAAQ